VTTKTRPPIAATMSSAFNAKAAMSSQKGMRGFRLQWVSMSAR
jgi:hypothetical protein